MANENKEDRRITKKDVEDSLELMLKVNAVSEAVLIRYISMLDFIESKGLMQEWQYFFLDHVLKKQNPEGN